MNSHSINDCRVFRMSIQKAIQEGHLKFDNKMKLDGHPFPQNMVGFSVNMVTAEEKGKVKVLTSARARQDGTVDLERQVTLEQVHGEAPCVLKIHIEIGESSKAKPRVTTHILLNKWQRQLEKERYQKRKYEEERRRAEEEARRRDLEQYTREQERAHWGCAFFRHCWNEGLKLPTLRNCLSVVTGISSTGRRLPIADPSTRELEGFILARIGAKILKSLIILGKSKLV
jgi:hypothetical protein